MDNALLHKADELADSLAAVAAQLDRENRPATEFFPQMMEAGFFGLQYPTEYGGGGLSAVTAYQVLSRIAEASAGVALTFHVHWMAIEALLKYATPEQKERWLPDLISGRKIASYTISEVNAGSDASSMEAVASKVEGGYLLNGIKYFATNGTVAEIHVIAVKTDPSAGAKGISVFVLERGAEGLSYGPLLDKMGCRSSDTTSLILKDCFVPEAHRIGAENRGFGIAMYGLVSGRLGMASMGLGIAKASLKEAVAYANKRMAFGKPLASLYAVQRMISEMHVKVQTAEQMVDKVAGQMDAGEDCALDTSVVKLLVSDTVREVTHNALQIFGGHGYVKPCPVERYARDGRLMDIGVGASEVLHMVVGSQVLRASK